jgi:hypothetical protein
VGTPARLVIHFNEDVGYQGKRGGLEFFRRQAGSYGVRVSGLNAWGQARQFL